MVELLDLVDELTKPRIEHVPQRSDTGQWIRSHSVEHPSLFDQLKDAGSGRTHGGSGAARHERAPVDLDALFLWTEYTSQVVEWCRAYRVPYVRDPVKDLRSWYVATLTDLTFDPGDHLRRLGAWIRTIRDHFDPPVKFEAIDECPVCGSSAFGSAVTGGGRAIEISYRIDDDRRVSDERALCRACRTVWQGGESLRELAEEMYEKRRNVG